MATLSYRTIFISDTHLGIRAARTEYLLDFLKHVECQNLYLVGDIFDIWKMKTGWYWPSINNEIIRCIVEMARRGTRVVYIPGNHDELFREYQAFHFSGIDVRTVVIHTAQDGRSYLVLHGDEFDGDLARLLAAADVMVFPCRTDTFGLVMLEAMASGVPVAAYPVEGPLDIVKNGINGWMDESLEVAALKALEVDSQTCRQFATGFSWNACTKQFMALIESHQKTVST